VKDLFEGGPKFPIDEGITGREIIEYERRLEMMKTSKGMKAKKVSFDLLAPEAGNVSVAGEFNNWDPTSHPMKKDKKGLWKVSLSLVPGTYQYRFFVDGQWQNDPTCTSSVGNPFGTSNSVKRVG
jgi:1,4-alpha-glucan branching enzyme